jgi:mycothiol system anti-sigma-R factor
VSADSNRIEPGSAGPGPAQPSYRKASFAPHIGYPASPASVAEPHYTGEAASGHLDCAEALHRVYLYLDGEIDAGTSADARAHLEECGPCLREYGLEEEVKRLVRRACACDDVPSGLRDRVLLRLRQVTITLRFD